MIVLVAAALAFAVAEMSVTYLVARRLRNFGIVDVVWAIGFAPITALFYLLAPRHAATPSGHLASPSLVLLVMVSAWSIRLGWHLLARVKAHHPVEDVRYAQLRAEWGAHVGPRMYRFFLFQGAIQVLLALPFAWVCLDPSPRGAPFQLGVTGALGIMLWLIGITGESVADRQLSRFRSLPQNRGKVCKEGLWNWSRHPNYFFEWVVWVGYGVFASGSDWGWSAWISPALMLHFLLNVTGIPMTEALSIRSKGDAYRLYQETTSAFFPRPPRKPPATSPT